jgi:geranylgeranyl diphosphate synthase type I
MLQMDAKPYLKDYIGRADGFLDKFFEAKKKEVSDIGRDGRGMSVAIDMLERYKKFSHGGKKLRGALIQLGYEIAGGKNKDVLPASTCIEIIHSFLLMHDDIMDKDSLRRGSPTIHKQYEAHKKVLENSRDIGHYGVSMGIDMGDLGDFLGMEVLLGSKLPGERKVKAATYLARLLQRVSFGQGLDVTYEQMENITEADVMQVHLHKTSIYTIGGPLKIGALLGGLDEKHIKAIEDYGKPVGIAFQVRDDELGLFSDEETLGKPVGGDVKEGKNTILHIKAVELAMGEDKKFLIWAYGNPDISEKDVERVRDITVKTGALAYSQKLARGLVEKGKKFVPQTTSEPKLQDTLMKMADFMIERSS